MSQYGFESVGDNIEFTAVAIGDYTLVFNATGTDSEFIKYATNTITAGKFIIRTNQSALLVEENGIAFTDPITIILNKSHTETRNTPAISKIKIRTTVANTAIKVRWF